jgi:hypothetical protein
MGDDGAVAPGGSSSSPATPGGSDPARALGVVIQRRLVQFDPVTGYPVVVIVPTLTKTQIGDTAAAALSLPYEDPLNLEPQYKGLTNVEVAMTKVAKRAALNADLADVEMLLDRAIGRPKNTAENVNLNVNGTYEDFLRSVAAKVTPSSPSPTIVDAEVVGGEVVGDDLEGLL